MEFLTALAGWAVVRATVVVLERAMECATRKR